MTTAKETFKALSKAADALGYNNMSASHIVDGGRCNAEDSMADMGFDHGSEEYYKVALDSIGILLSYYEDDDVDAVGEFFTAHGVKW